MSSSIARTSRGPLALTLLVALVVAGMAFLVSPGSATTKVGICHATGNGGYVFIEVDEHAVNAHMNHQHGRDVMATNGNCPSASPSPTPTVTATPTASATVTATATPTATPTVTPTVAPVTVINICHANVDGTFATVSVDAVGDFSGHLADVNDIIPPVGDFAGLNWTVDTQATFANGCVVPSEAVIAPAAANVPADGSVAPLSATVPTAVSAGGGSTAPALPTAGLLLLLLGAVGAAISGIRLAAARK